MLASASIQLVSWEKTNIKTWILMYGYGVTKTCGFMYNKLYSTAKLTVKLKNHHV